jgi:endonuclease/exonuclease/phosphatase family metal-dependent hydrolase
VKVGTWNLENLFRPDTGSGSPTTGPAYDAKLAALSRTVNATGIDVLAVQEVGSPGALADLMSRLDGSWTADLATPDGRGIRVGVISRLPVLEVEAVRSFPAHLAPVQVDDDGTTMDEMGRPALRVRVRAPGTGAELGTDIDVVSVHLKSKLLSFPGGRFSPRDEDERARYAVYALHRRAAEASAVRVYATAVLGDQGRDRLMVVAGDLNDEPAAASTQILLGPPGSEIGTAGFERPDRGDGQRLWNLAALIPEEERYTRVYRGRPELIDHALVSKAAVDKVVEVRTGGPPPQSVTDDPTQRVDEPGSDHRPVVVTLDV